MDQLGQESAPTKRVPRRVLGIVGTVSILLIVGAISLYGIFVHKLSFQEVVSVAALPADLRHITFIASGKEVSTVYRPTFSGYDRESIPGFILGSASSKKNPALFLLSNEVNSPAYIWHGSTTVLPHETNQYVSLSPNGESMAFPVREISSSTPPTKGWSIYVASSKTPTAFSRLSTGFAAFYIDNDNLLFFTEGGVYVYDFKKSEATLVHRELFPRVPVFLSLSPDRTHIAWTSALTKTTTIYNASATRLDPIATLPQQFSGGTQLGNQGLYQLRNGGAQSEFWSISYTGTEKKVLSLPFRAIFFTNQTSL